MFKDREEAGKKLARLLEKFRGNKSCIVLGLARGGVVVAAEVAKELSLPLSVIVPRKLGAPGNPELAIGAVLETGEGYFNESLIRELGVSKKYLAQEIKKQRAKAQERQALFVKERPLLKNKTVLLIDDGIATGATMFASILAVKKQNPSQIVVAVPVCALSTIQALKTMADDVFCLSTEDFGSVSMSYVNFSEVQDKDVIALLSQNDYI